MIWGLYVWVFVLGACFGSFANVIIHRWPREKNLVSPSQCPQCHHKIPFYENVPILSWFFLQGRCSRCKTLISWMYPGVECLTGFIFVCIFDITGISLTTLDMFIFTILAVPCFFIDLKHMYLPDIMTLTGLVLALLISFIHPEKSFVASFLGALVGGGIFWLIASSYKKWRGIDGMGGGDIKLLAWLGALFGVSAIPSIMLFSSISGSLVGAYFILFQGKDSKTLAIPFGPFLIGAAYLYFGLSAYNISFYGILPFHDFIFPFERF